ncbi:FABP family protein [Methylocapsa acidiphila]|uniref:FABP family protein n=1 Tax=Methylocapsa acidiphila TaxID=133552 RepID=UPI000417C473|nr:heme-binding beta-barrel domain-containing protein [Methylocapsa acidiphila]
MTDIYSSYRKDIYTEPADVDIDTLQNLGPLRSMAGVWRGSKGLDVNPKAAGPETQAFVERLELQPIDPQTNGPQLFYGLRYHQHIVKPGEVETYHDQIGYWLWEPATETIIQTLAIPRGQVAMAVGRAAPESKEFELVASRGLTTYGICSNVFLEEAFRTDEYRIKITINDDGTWSYDETTTLVIKGETRFAHTDKDTLIKIGEPALNPLAKAKSAR